MEKHRKYNKNKYEFAWVEQLACTENMGAPDPLVNEKKR